MPWLRDSTDAADLAVARVQAVEGLRGVHVHPRTGCVVVWAGVDLDGDALAALFVDAPDPRPTLAAAASSAVVADRHGPHASTGEVARLVVGGLALAGVAFAKVILRRPAAVSGRNAGALATVAVFTGMPFFRGAVRTLAGRPGNGTNLLVTAATAASLILRQNVVALTVLWLLNVGEFLQELTLRRTRSAIAHLLSLGEERAWLVVSGVQVDVASDTLAPGDVVAVYSHHKIPVDGDIVRGDALVQQAAVTGEALPVVVGPGARVYAGTLVTDGSIQVRATDVGRDTVVGRIIDRVEQAQADRAPVQTVATRFTRRFVPVSFAMAALTYLATRDARRAITMLLVACPCAAGLSTPTAISAAIGNGARRGALIKGGAHLENAGRVTAVVFDKTGTLTLGRPLVTDVVALCEKFTTEQILALAASGEIHARHPLAQAVIRHTEEQHIEIPLHTQCEVVLGMGMRADLEGNRLLVGSPTLMRRDGVELTVDAHQWVARLRGESKTVLCIAHNGILIGILGVADAIRSDSESVLDRLRSLGVRRVVMLTGDSETSAAAVARTLGITEYVAEALPERKLEVVRALQAEGHVVAMIGDGTNDAPALALADISMSMGSHASDVAIETADVALVGSDLGNVASVVQLSRRTMTVIRQNYGLSIGVNILGLLAGAGGGLSPVLAAVLHNASSVAVVANSARLVRYEPGAGPNGHPRPGAGHVPLAYGG